MNGARERFAEAAASFLGTPFRLHGRDQASGLDCVGLLVAALRAIGRFPANPRDYHLRSSDFTPFLRQFEHAGFREQAPPLLPGDVVQVVPGPGQLHFLVVSLRGDFIHAHAGLSRVVRTPPPLEWNAERIWRLQHD